MEGIVAQIEVGNAPDSWGIWFPKNDRQVSYHVFLDEVAAAGYSCIELGPWGYLPTNASVLEVELASRNLKLVASTVGCNLLEEESIESVLVQLPEITALQKELGAKFVVLLPAMFTDLFTGEVVLNKTLSDEERDQFNRNIGRIGRIVREQYGLVLTAHPHVDSHLETEADIESLLAATSAEDVSLCLDVGHHAYGGGDACGFIKKHIGRIPYIHLKNCDADILAQMRKEGWSFAHAVTKNIMCEPWRGMVDFKQLKAVLDDVGYQGYAVVEQDMYPAPPARPFPVACDTRNYLSEVGIG
ncbi:xylose isomerase domain-containing protein (plasmid) [Rhizobium etli bv. mimosae str. Mim1]|nr:xylose isomerase domain-containing protein [Rhizobium etli bv. mimosae str. Mim1]